MVARLGEVMWVVDLNRQSLDRVVPDIAAGRLAAMFEAAGWHTVMVKYGPRLRPAPRPARPHRRDAQRGVPAAARAPTRTSCASGSRSTSTTSTTTSCWPPSATSAATTSRACSTATARPTRSATARASSSPTRSRAGRCRPRAIPPTTPRCSTTSSTASWRPSSARTRTTRSTPLDARLARGRAVRGDRPPAQARRHARRPRAQGPARPRPQAHRQGLHPAGLRPLLRRPHARGARTWRERVVTVSPDVGTSTNLGGWINKAGIWSVGDRIDWFADDTDTLVRWREHDHGRHIELGIAEVNLVGLLGELGATWSRDGQPLLPGRHDLRPVRVARAGAVVVRDLRRRPVDPRRHAVRRHARPRGRRAPVGDHAVASASSSPAASPTSPRSARTSSGASCTRSPSSASPAGRAPTSASRRARSTSRHHTGTREEAIAGGYRLRPHDTPDARRSP